MIIIIITLNKYEMDTDKQNNDSICYIIISEVGYV